MPANCTSRPASRASVQVESRARRSIVRDCSAGNLAEARSGTNVTFSASPSVAAATARQKSTSSPDQRPDASLSEKTAMPSLTPQRSVPRDLICASVSPAAADGVGHAMTKSTAAAETSSLAKAMTDTDRGSDEVQAHAAGEDRRALNGQASRLGP